MVATSVHVILRVLGAGWFVPMTPMFGSNSADVVATYVIIGLLGVLGVGLVWLPLCRTAGAGGWGADINRVLGIGLPVVAVQLVKACTGSVLTVMFVGRFFVGDAVALGATSMAFCYFNITAFSVCLGLASGLDTLNSQAHGAGDTYLQVTYFKRAVIVLLMAFVPMFVLEIYCAQILLALGQPTEVAELAGKIVRVLVVGLPLYMIYDLECRTLRTMNVVRWNLFSSIFGLATNLVLGYMVLSKWAPGWVFGAAWANVAARGTYALVLGIAMVVMRHPVCTLGFGIGKQPHNISFADRHERSHGHSRTRGGGGDGDAEMGSPVTQPLLQSTSGPEQSRAAPPKAATVAGIKGFLALALPSMCQNVAEWWSFEMIAILAGLLPNPVINVAAHGCLLNVCCFVYQIPRGVGMGACTLVGNCLGAGDTRGAKRMWLIGMLGSLMVACLFGAAAFVGRQYMGHAFTSNDAVVAVVVQSALPLAASMCGYAALMVNVQSMQGAGLQKAAALIILISYYCVGLPLGLLLAKDWGVPVFNQDFELGLPGLWWGNAAALIFGSVASTVYISRIDWDEVAKVTSKRIASETTSGGAAANGTAAAAAAAGPPLHRKPVIWIDLNTKFHNEVTWSWIHFLSGRPLPFRSEAHGSLQRLLDAASRHGGSETWVTAQHIESCDDRVRILKNRMREYNVKLGTPPSYDLRVIITAYGDRVCDGGIAFPRKNFPELQNDPNTLVVVHENDPVYEGWENAWCLMPQARHYILPTFFPFKKARPDPHAPPIFLVQGSIDVLRRNYQSLANLMAATAEYDYSVKCLGGSAVPDADGARRLKGNLPENLQPFADRIILRSGLDDELYHQEIQECSFILPLLDETTNQAYFSSKLSSSVSYGVGFGVPFIAHNKLRRAYPMIGSDPKSCFYDSDAGFIEVAKRCMDSIPGSASPSPRAAHMRRTSK